MYDDDVIERGFQWMDVQKKEQKEKRSLYKTSFPRVVKGLNVKILFLIFIVSEKIWTQKKNNFEMTRVALYIDYDS